MSSSRVIRRTEAGWTDVEPRGYKDAAEGPFLHVVRHTLLGARGTRLEPDLSFEVRYFEVGPGGYSSLERHRHPHAVVILSGRGAVRLGDRREPLGPLDLVYVAPGEVHRFEADAYEPLGFLCVVDRERDRPEPVREHEVGE